MDRSGQALAAVSRIYGLVSTPEPERAWLDLVRDLPGAEHAMLSQPGRVGPLQSCSRVPTWLAPTIARFNEDPAYLGVANRMPLMTVSRMWDYFSICEMKRTDMYEQVFRPMHGGIAAMFAWREAGRLSVINICRDAELERTFSPSELTLLQQVLPHLSHAMHLQELLVQAAQTRREAHAALDAIRAGVVLLDATGGVRFVNRAGESIIGDGDALVLAAGRLRAIGFEADSRLQTLLQDVAAIPLADWSGASRRSQCIGFPTSSRLFVDRPPPRRPLRLTVLPATGLLSADAGNEGSRIVLIDDPDRETAASVDRVALEHGLTGREAALAWALGSGLSLDAAAVTMGITVGTARQYLKSVFAKTGVHRQVELVERILRR